MWDTLEIDWSDVNLECGSKALQLTSSITITLIDKFTVINILSSNKVTCFMLGLTGITW